MWNFRREPLSRTTGFRFTLLSDLGGIGFDQVIRAWQNDPAFRQEFNALLAELPFTAFRWETPPVTEATLARPFEFVVLDSPSLSRPADPEAFAEHFQDGGEDVVAFPNLGGDAILIVPRPTNTPGAYTHLADFVRNAPEWQRDALWRTVGEAMTRRVSKKPVWLSTAGAGVAWLHLRLDDRPKYYGHEPYRREQSPL
jgi:hypothetical protein